ncbi:hypothetical protein halTADL_2421 [Halohasta litchfieldiae]|jgi:hypothetical protein|uniref:Uncharacterized protein n=1 Tax=Halohasta litchfieldiae TaxID=1073996 RepID=A0A1H6XXB9_9EURY|nr:hypothetical protein [Halohasta litchfieldiae]ATW89161.1 hypothetical protein halTADL_2421 [Halohasta litchfieldiae]SEJ29532.1 hypothetical protein SAMN05444271_14118 [Halohasta litchfieldiae]
MASSEPVESVDETEATDDESTASVSWGPIRFARVRSLLFGCLLVFVVGIVGGLGVLTAIIALDVLSGESQTSGFVVLAVGLIFIGGPFSLFYWLIAYDRSTSTERASIRELVVQTLPERSTIRPLWVGCGAAVSVGFVWIGSESLLGVLSILPLVCGLSFPLVFGMRGIEYTVDSDRNTVSTHVEWGDRTFEQQLTWAVGVRRVDLGIVSLFVFSNRGKRWYEGPHSLFVPTALAADVERLLRQMVEEQAPPTPIRRDERIIVGGVGLSMLGIGPLLYLLSGEAGLLLLIAGPSAFIAPGLLLHSIRG